MDGIKKIDIVVAKSSHSTTDCLNTIAQCVMKMQHALKKAGVCNTCENRYHVLTDGHECCIQTELMKSFQHITSPEELERFKVEKAKMEEVELIGKINKMKMMAPQRPPDGHKNNLYKY